MLEIRHEESGPRHYLNDRPIRAGDSLEVLTDKGWVEGHYEWTFRETDQPYLVVNDDEAIPITSDTECRIP